MRGRSKASTETRQRILEAALTCFMHQGYNSTTMDDIADESGTSKGTLYWYFKSKEELFESAIRSFFEEDVMTETLTALDPAPTATAKLGSLAQMLVELSSQAAGLFNLYLEYWASVEDREQASALWIDALMRYKDLVAGIIQQGVDEGEFRPVDAEGLTWALLATYDGLAAYALLKPDLDFLGAHTAFFETMLRGLEVEA